MHGRGKPALAHMFLLHAILDLSGERRLRYDRTICAKQIFLTLQADAHVTNTLCFSQFRENTEKSFGRKKKSFFLFRFSIAN